MELNNFSSKPTTLSIGQEEAIKELWVSEDGKMRLGVWECTEGTFTADRTAMGEYCHIILALQKSLMTMMEPLKISAQVIY